MGRLERIDIGLPSDLLAHLRELDVLRVEIRKGEAGPFVAGEEAFARILRTLPAVEEP